MTVRSRNAEYWTLGVLKWGSIAFFVAITLFPLLYMYVSSLKPDDAVLANSSSLAAFLPTPFNGLANYADALVRELLVSFSYVARQYTDASVTRLLLTGAGASGPGMGEHLAKELALETKPGTPADMA